MKERYINIMVILKLWLLLHINMYRKNKSKGKALIKGHYTATSYVNKVSAELADKVGADKLKVKTAHNPKWSTAQLSIIYNNRRININVQSNKEALLLIQLLYQLYKNSKQ